MLHDGHETINVRGDGHENVNVITISGALGGACGDITIPTDAIHCFAMPVEATIAAPTTDLAARVRNVLHEPGMTSGERLAAIGRIVGE